MGLKHIDRELSVAPQISIGDVAAIAEAGFKTIICNRPDGESNDQPSFREIEEAARAVGLEIHHQPVSSGKVSDADAAAFGELVDAAPKPVLAYCRSGTRSITLWALSQAERLPPTEILAKAKAAGYDMSSVMQRFVPQA